MKGEVWDDAIPRIQAVADQLGITFEMPNEDAGPRPSPPAPWVQIEVSAESYRPIELGGDTWEELGQIFISLMIPIGSGIRPWLDYLSAFELAFRGLKAGMTPEGLVYSENQSSDPLQWTIDDGMYRRLPLIVRYKFQDRLTTAPP
jgi:hypothetical protein